MLVTSPDRGSFSIAKYVEILKTDPTNEDALRWIGMYKMMDDKCDESQADDAWKKNNLEYDLRSSPYIIEKCKVDKYAQNVYASMCNVEWQRTETFPILANERWGCSWRSAGGIVANLQGKGDYIDWYCSGSGKIMTLFDNIGIDDIESPDFGYVAEGEVTQEIKDDFAALGWHRVVDSYGEV